MRYDAGSCDVAVVGAGHAGIEAALAAAQGLLGADGKSRCKNGSRQDSIRLLRPGHARTRLRRVQRAWI